MHIVTNQMHIILYIGMGFTAVHCINCHGWYEALDSGACTLCTGFKKSVFVLLDGQGMCVLLCRSHAHLWR